MSCPPVENSLEGWFVGHVRESSIKRNITKLVTLVPMTAPIVLTCAAA